MYRGAKVAVCIPAHNEEKHIKNVVTTIPSFVDLIVVVDDHSSDSTLNVLESIEDKRLVVIHHTENRGVGGSTISAQMIACKHEADIIVRMDGDEQMDPRYISTLLDPIILGVAQYTKGNRLVTTDHLTKMPKIRIFGNIVLTYMNKILTGYWSIMDSQNGYTAISREALEKIDYTTLARGYMFENDMLFRLNQTNAIVLDVSMPAHYGEEVSGISIKKVIPQYLRFFSIAVLKRLYRKYILRPNALFILSVICFILLFATGAYSLFIHYWGRALIIWTISLCFLFLGIGIDINNEPKIGSNN